MPTSSVPAIMMAPKTFFDLPAEIRNIIYRLAFQRPTDAISTLVMKQNQAAFKPGQVLRISKTFNIEAAPFIYGSRNFAFSCISNAVCFLMSIGKSYSALLTSIDLGPFSYTDHETRGLQWTLQCDFEDVPSASIKLLAQNCPQLRSIKSWGLRDPYDSLEERITRLEGFEPLVNAFPRLSNTSDYHNCMLLTVPDIPVPENFQTFDIAQDVRELKDKKKEKDEAERQRELRGIVGMKATLEKSATAAKKGAASSA